MYSEARVPEAGGNAYASPLHTLVLYSAVINLVALGLAGAACAGLARPQATLVGLELASMSELTRQFVGHRR